MDGHRLVVSQVEFCDDGTKVVSGSDDTSVRIWDVASSNQVSQLVGFRFALAGGGPSGEQKSDRLVLTANGDSLLLWEGAEDGVVCFKAPQPITAVQCQGAAICVGCDGGAVCILSAPFLSLSGGGSVSMPEELAD